MLPIDSQLTTYHLAPYEFTEFRRWDIYQAVDHLS